MCRSNIEKSNSLEDVYLENSSKNLGQILSGLLK